MPEGSDIVPAESVRDFLRCWHASSHFCEAGAPYDLTIAILVRDEDGTFALPFGKRLRGTVPRGEIPNVRLNGMKYDTEFETPTGGRYFGRVVVRDNLTGRIGTITLALPGYNFSRSLAAGHELRKANPWAGPGAFPIPPFGY